MLRRVAHKTLQHHGGKLAPVFLFAGIALLCLLPIFRGRRTFIDENAVGHMHPEIGSGVAEVSLDPVVHWSQRLVRGRRSPGSELIAVYVNRDYTAAVSLANALVEVIRGRDGLACDVQFYFVSSVEEWPVPKAYTRAALVLNISSLNSRSLCVDTLGSNGIQPNQDYPNLVVQLAAARRFSVEYLCQKTDFESAGPRSAFWHYWAYLETSLQLSRHPQRWHTIPTHGINTLAISTDARRGKLSSSPDPGLSNALVKFALHVIVSLNGLEERFHHSTFVWLPLSTKTYVEYDHAQFCILLFVAAMFSTAYAEYQRSGVTLSPLFLVPFLVPFAASMALETFGWLGAIAASASAVLMLRLLLPCATSGLWLSFNAIALCLLIILQPACGLLAGAAAAIQLIFLHPALQIRPVMLLGVGTSWALSYYFIGYLHLPILGTWATSELYVSFVIYLNAVWVSSRLLCKGC